MESSRLAEMDPRVVGYLDIPRLARQLDTPEHVVRAWARQGKIRGLVKVGVAWLVPVSEAARLAPLGVEPPRDS